MEGGVSSSLRSVSLRGHTDQGHCYLLVAPVFIIALPELYLFPPGKEISEEIMQILTNTLVSSWAHFVPEDESRVHKSMEQMNN